MLRFIQVLWMAAIAALLGASTACAQTPGVTAAKSNRAFHQEGKVHANGIEIAYQLDGPADGIPLVFIVGLAGQMSKGRDGLTQALVDKGFRVLRFDNRDAGLSTHMSKAGAPPEMSVVIEALKAGRQPPLAYTILDMAKDTVGLMDALKIEKAHIMGGSMGGMIAQTLVSQFPDRALSLISVSSTSGNSALAYGPAIQKMMENSAPAKTAEERLNRKVELFQVLEGSRYREDPVKLRESLRTEIDRSDDQVAVARQSMAIVPYADRREWLKSIKQPALVIHGSEDPLFPLPHGKDQVDNLPNAHFEVIEGMGHIMSGEAVPALVDMIYAHVKRLP